MCGRFGFIEEPETLEGALPPGPQGIARNLRGTLEQITHHSILTAAKDENPASPDKNNAKLRRWGLSVSPS